jgi:hypothetical protein
MTQKLATEMSDAEYAAAKAAAINHRPGLTAEERADLASRGWIEQPQAKDARELTDAEYEAEKAKLIRGSYK